MKPSTGEPAYNEALGAKKKIVIEELRYQQTEEKSSLLIAFFQNEDRSMFAFSHFRLFEQLISQSFEFLSSFFLIKL